MGQCGISQEWAGQAVAPGSYAHTPRAVPCPCLDSSSHQVRGLQLPQPWPLIQVLTEDRKDGGKDDSHKPQARDTLATRRKERQEKVPSPSDAPLPGLKTPQDHGEHPSQPLRVRAANQATPNGEGTARTSQEEDKRGLYSSGTRGGEAGWTARQGRDMRRVSGGARSLTGWGTQGQGGSGQGGPFQGAHWGHCTPLPGAAQGGSAPGSTGHSARRQRNLPRCTGRVAAAEPAEARGLCSNTPKACHFPASHR